MLKNEKGFTLVELAIVLMIIGLLIGGILRGQELMNNARLGSIMKQVTSYGGAINTFRDAYASTPGDMPTATARLPGCATAGSSCQNGNGNGVIGDLTLTWNGGQQGVQTENTQFWKHLALMHIISGVNPNAATPVWGQTHPAAALPGGFDVITSQGAGRASIREGALILRLHGNLNDGNVEETPVLSPHQAAYIDRKMDDGKPQTGDVQSRANGNGALVAACEGDENNVAVGYDETREDNFCVTMFVLTP